MSSLAAIKQALCGPSAGASRASRATGQQEHLAPSFGDCADADAGGERFMARAFSCAWGRGLTSAQQAQGRWPLVRVRAASGVMALEKDSQAAEDATATEELPLDGRVTQVSFAQADGARVWVLCSAPEAGITVLDLEEADEAAAAAAADRCARSLYERAGGSADASKTDAFKALVAGLSREVSELRSWGAEVRELATQPGRLLDINPLGRSAKSAEGWLMVRSASQDDGGASTSLARKYFVLEGKRLFYFNGAQDECPSGFVVLRDGQVSRMGEQVARGEFCLALETPLHALVLQFPHRVAMEEWLAALSAEAESAKCTTAVADASDAGQWQSLQSVLDHPQARQHFRRFVHGVAEDNVLSFFLGAKRHRQLCYRTERELEAKKRAKDTMRAAAPEREEIEEKQGTQEQKEATDDIGAEQVEGKLTEANAGAGMETEEAEAEEDEDAASAAALTALEESCASLLTDCYDPEGPGFVEVLADELEAAEELLGSGQYAECVVAGMAKALARLEELFDKEFVPSEDFSDMLVGLGASSEARPTLFGTKLLRVTGPAESSVFALQEGVTRVGRDWANELVLESTKVSRAHCSIEVDDVDTVVVKDLGSARGISVNGRRILCKALDAGDVIQVADHELELFIDVDR